MGKTREFLKKIKDTKGTFHAKIGTINIVCRLFDDGHSDQCEMISHCSFDLQFSNNERCWTSFLYSSSMYSCHFFLKSSAYVRSMPFLSFIVSICAWNVPLTPLIFLKQTLVFPIILFSCFLHIDHWARLSSFSLLFIGTLHSNGYSFPFLLCL